MQLSYLTLVLLLPFSTYSQTTQPDSLKGVIITTIDRMFRPVIADTNTNEAGLNDMLTLASKKYGEIGEQVVLNLAALHYYIKYNNRKLVADFDKWLFFKKRLNRTYPDFISDAFTLNNDAWFVFLHSKNQKQLIEALKWSEKAITIEPLSGNWLDTYANILFKLGRKREAILYQEKALALDPGNPDIQAGLKMMQQ
jgi:tetratricopeptide (TPR) repeat protein